MPAAAADLERAGFSAWMAALLARRGVADRQAADGFLAPSLDQLHDPFRLAGMEAAVARLLAARERGERVAIVGDYDVDGITATALLAVVLTACGIGVEPILPHRLREGYGFQPLHVARAAELGCRLILTADCGSSAGEAVSAALAAGLDVVVTRVLDPLPLLRIACLGTIADLVPLRGENRVIAALGLRTLGESRSLGLRALIQQAGLKPPFSAADVGYRLGPRLNAAGRLDDAGRALELLLSRDRGRARQLALELDGCNRERQAQELQVVEDARRRLLERLPLPAILVAWSPDWHQGVLGIAAGRIAKEMHRPTLLLSVHGALATGSGRSVPDVALHAFLVPWQARLRRFGGHAQAVGLTLDGDRLDELRDEWERSAAAAWEPAWLQKRHVYDFAAPPGAVSAELVAELHRLEPFGQGNPPPLVRCGPLRLRRPPRPFGKGHLAAECAGEDGARVELVGWNWEERSADLAGSFEVLAHPELDGWHGGPVLRLVDSRPL